MTHTFPKFRRQAIYQGAPGERTSCIVGDINGDGVPEVVIATRVPGREAIWLKRHALGRVAAALDR